MLYTKTVTRETLKLLRVIMNDLYLREFSLAGGTALSLLESYQKNTQTPMQ